MISPTTTSLVSEAVFTRDKSGSAAATSTSASAVTAGKLPCVGVALRVAVFVIVTPESISSCVTT